MDAMKVTGPLRLFYCYNCSTAFGPTAKNTCTNCGADGDDPQARGCVAEQLVHHYDPPHAILVGRGLGHHACDPKVKVGTGGKRATGSRDAVNCPACRASKAFLDVGQREEESSPYHVPEVPADALRFDVGNPVG